jgi:hypothetical protein
LTFVRGSLVVGLLLAACAAPEAASVEAIAAAAPPSSPSSPPRSRAAGLAERFRCERVAVAGWPVRGALPRTERCYEVAFLWADVASDGWSYELLVDADNPRLLWVRRTGTIVGGIVSYLGPAWIVDDMGPLVLRVGER